VWPAFDAALSRLDIGTAKPTPAERRSIPHHLIDVLGPKDDATAGGYRQLALQILEDLRQRKRLPVFTVGTDCTCAPARGSCGRSAALGRIAPASPRKRSRTSAGHLHRVLKRLDPEAAAKIAPGDEQKLIRAVEVCILIASRFQKYTERAAFPWKDGAF